MFCELAARSALTFTLLCIAVSCKRVCRVTISVTMTFVGWVYGFRELGLLKGMFGYEFNGVWRLYKLLAFLEKPILCAVCLYLFKGRIFPTARLAWPANVREGAKISALVAWLVLGSAAAISYWLVATFTPIR
jgi:hypothetical protein